MTSFRNFSSNKKVLGCVLQERVVEKLVLRKVKNNTTSRDS